MAELNDAAERSGARRVGGHDAAASLVVHVHAGSVDARLYRTRSALRPADFRSSWILPLVGILADVGSATLLPRARFRSRWPSRHRFRVDDTGR